MTHERNESTQKYAQESFILSEGTWVERLERRVRDELGLNWKAFALKAGVRYTTLMSAMRRHSNPEGQTLRRIAVAAGVDLHWLLTGEAAATPGAEHSPEEAQLLDDWRGLSAGGKEFVRRALTVQLVAEQAANTKGWGGGVVGVLNGAPSGPARAFGSGLPGWYMGATPHA